MKETMKEQKKTVVRQAVRKVLAYMEELSVRNSQEEIVEIVEFTVKDEGIGFYKNPLRIENLEDAPAKMDDIRAEVQDPVEEF